MVGLNVWGCIYKKHKNRELLENSVLLVICNPLCSFVLPVLQVSLKGKKKFMLIKFGCIF